MPEITDSKYMLKHVLNVFDAIGTDNSWELHVAIDFPIDDSSKKLELAKVLLSIEPGKYDRVEFHSQPSVG